MVVLMIGDVVGAAGCKCVARLLPGLKKFYGVDITVANGENSDESNGMSPRSTGSLFAAGVDIITGGNHSLRHRQIYAVLDEQRGVLRPANLHRNAPGSGVFVYDHPRFSLCVVNLQGIVYMQNLPCPFDCVDKLLPGIETPNILVDFHAEATAEKLCMAYYLDGRVSAVVGTHTHVATADARVLPGGTATITDVGMCGGYNSVLGVKAPTAIEKMRTSLPVRFENDPDDVRLSAVVLDIDEKTGKCRSIESLVHLS